jgi:hypothetical protein
MSDSHSQNRIAIVRMSLIEIVCETDADYARVAPPNRQSDGVLVPVDAIIAIEPRNPEADPGANP